MKPLITPQANETFLVEYTPKEEGLHSVNVFFAGQQIPKSPFGVAVSGRKWMSTESFENFRFS